MSCICWPIPMRVFGRGIRNNNQASHEPYSLTDVTMPWGLGWLGVLHSG